MKTKYSIIGLIVVLSLFSTIASVYAAEPIPGGAALSKIGGVINWQISPYSYEDVEITLFRVTYVDEVTLKEIPVELTVKTSYVSKGKIIIRLDPRKAMNLARSMTKGERVTATVRVEGKSTELNTWYVATAGFRWGRRN